MLKQALTSVTFRARTHREIIELAAQTGLDAIEWGGDVHVPPGDLDAARAVRRMTEAAGLGICAYGSYYRAGEHEDAEASFAPVLQSAVALRAPVIRVWAGAKGSAAFGAADRARLFAALAALVDMAGREGIRVATEYHANTFTDTLCATLDMLRAAPGLATFWQPPVGLPHEDNLRALDALAGRVESLHVYEWTAAGARRPLCEGSSRWPAYLARAAAWPGEHCCTTEFVLGDSVDQFIEDADCLRRWLRAIEEEKRGAYVE